MPDLKPLDSFKVTPTQNLIEEETNTGLPIVGNIYRGVTRSLTEGQKYLSSFLDTLQAGHASMNEGYSVDKQSSILAAYGTAAFGGDPYLGVKLYNKDGKTEASLPSQRDIQAKFLVDNPINLVHNLQGIGLDWLGAENQDPKQTAFGGFLETTKLKGREFLGAKNNHEMNAEELSLSNFNESLSSVIWTSALMTVLGPKVPGLPAGVAGYYSKVPKPIRGILRWSLLAGIEEGGNSLFESFGNQGSLFDLFSDSPLKIRPEDSYSKVIGKAMTGNFVTANALAGFLRTIPEVPNIYRHTKQVAQATKDKITWKWLKENNLLTEDGKTLIKSDTGGEVTPEVKPETVEVTPEVKPETVEVTPEVKQKTVAELTEELINKPEVDVVVKQAQELDDEALQKIADGEGSVVDELEVAAENQAKISDAIEDGTDFDLAETLEIADDDPEFLAWLKNPPEEYKELFQNIDESFKSSEETIARAKELFKEITSGLDEQEKLLKEGSQYDELSPTDQARVDLEVGLMKDDSGIPPVGTNISRGEVAQTGAVFIERVDKGTGQTGPIAYDLVVLELQELNAAQLATLNLTKADLEKMTPRRTINILKRNFNDVRENLLPGEYRMEGHSASRRNLYKKMFKDDPDVIWVDRETSKASTINDKNSIPYLVVKEQSNKVVKNAEVNLNEATFIPEDLNLGKASYGMGEVIFSSRIDHAAWLVRPGRKSYPNVSKQIAKLAKENNIDISDLRRHGGKVHEQLKAQVTKQTGSAKASPDNTAGLSFSVTDQKFGRVALTQATPDPVVPYKDQWASMSFKDLKKLSTKKNNPQLNQIIRNLTGKDARSFTKGDIILGLQKLREQGITVRPQDMNYLGSKERNELVKKVVQKAINQDEVVPSTPKNIEAEELKIDLNDPNTTSEQILAQEVELSKKYEIEDGIKEDQLKEIDRQEKGYYQMSFDEKKSNGLLDGWDRASVDDLRKTEIKDQLDLIDEDIYIAEGLINERTSRGLSGDSELDEGLEGLLRTKQELEIELKRLDGDVDVEFESLKNIRAEKSFVKYDPFMNKILKNRENLELFLSDTIKRIGGKDASFSFAKTFNKLDGAPEAWGGKNRGEVYEQGSYNSLIDHIYVYNVADGKSVTEINRALGTAAHEPFHRIQFGYMTLDEMKIFDSFDGRKRIKLFSRLNETQQTPFDRLSTATLEKMTLGFQEYALARLQGVRPFEKAMYQKLGDYLDFSFPRKDGQLWTGGKFHKALVAVANVWDRMYEVVTALGNYMNGRGFATVDSIYEAAFTGELARTRRFNSVMNGLEIADRNAQLLDKLNEYIPKLKSGKTLTAEEMVNYNRIVDEYEMNDSLYKKEYKPKLDRLKDWNSDNQKFLDFVELKRLDKLLEIENLKKQAQQGGC